MMSSDNEVSQNTESDGDNSFINDGVDWSIDDEINDREVHENIGQDEEIEKQVFRFAENTAEVNIAEGILDEILGKIVEAFDIIEEKENDTLSETRNAPEIDPVLETISEASSIDCTNSPVRVGVGSRSPSVTPPPASPTWAPSLGSKRSVEETYRRYGYQKKLRYSDFVLDEIEGKVEQHEKEDTSFDLKVSWKTTVVRVSVRKEELMGMIVDKLEKQLSLKCGSLRLYQGGVGREEVVSRTHTVAELGLGVASVLHGRLGLEGEGWQESLEVRLQRRERRAEVVVVRVLLTDTVREVMELFSQATQLACHRFRLERDGEELKEGSTMEAGVYSICFVLLEKTSTNIFRRKK